MAYSTRELGGKVWEELGLPDAEGSLSPAEAPTWAGLRPLLCSASLGEASQLALGVVCLDDLGDLDGAAELLEGVGGRLAAWLLQNVAIQRSSLELFDAATSGEPSGPGPAFLGPAEVTLLRAFLFGDLERAVRQAAAWEGAGVAGRVVFQILLALRGQWSELAAAAQAEGSPAAQLLAAHLLGDRLGDHGRQAELLRGQADTVVLPAETLLELSLRFEGIESAEAAVQRRLAALATMEGTAGEAAATALFRYLGGEESRCLPDFGGLSHQEASGAWYQLVHLVRLAASMGASPDLAGDYLKCASQVASPLAHAFRVRAAEHLMARDEWSAAVAALPDREPASEVLAQLVRRYRLICLVRLERWTELSSALTALATTERDERGGAFLLQAAALVALREPASAAPCLAAIERCQADLGEAAALPVLSTLLAAYRRCQDRASVARIWGRLVDRVSEQAVAGLFALGCGVAELALANSDRALVALQLARRHLGREPVTLAALAIAFTRAGRWPDVVEVYAELSSAVGGGAPIASEAAKQFLMTAALLSATRVRTGARALELIGRLVAGWPGDREVLRSAAAIELAAGRWNQAVLLLQRVAEVTDDAEEAVSFLCAAGTVQQDRLRDLGAAESNYRKALAVNPLHPGTLGGLRRLLAASERLEDLAPVLSALLRVAESREVRLELLLELSRLHRKLWDKTRLAPHAQDCIANSQQALAMAPGREEAIKHLVHVCTKLQRWQDLIESIDIATPSLPGLRALQRAFQETGRWDDLARTCMRVAETSPNRRESLTAALQAGDLHRNKLDDVKGAEVCYYWAAERHKSPEALARLAELLRAQDRHADLVQVLEQMLPMAEQPRRLPLHLELGALYGGPLRAPEAARRHYTAAVEIDGTNEVALAALEPLLERAGANEELARILEKRFQLRESGEEGLLLLLKLAAVYGELKDDRASLRVAGLLHQRFAGDEKAAAVAEQVYGAHGRFSELCDLYARRIEALEKESGAERQIADLLLRKGNIELQRLNSAQQAVESFARAVELCPEDMNALGLLERVLINAGDWQRLKAVYELRANRLTSRAEQIASLHRAAKIAHNQLHDEAESTRYYERIHALDPSDAQSFAYLERRLEVKNDYRRLVELLVNRAARVASKQEGLTCILRAAAISEKIHDIDRALKLYRQALSIDSSCLPALEAMARIYEALEQWDEFVKIIRWHIQVESSPANQAMLYFKLGSVMETQYQDDDEAVRNYTRAVSNSRTCLPALHSLRDLYSRRERWDKVVETLEREIPLWEDDKGRAEVLAQIAEIYANRLGEREKALAYYRRAVAAHKENMSAALALFEANIEQGDFAEAVAWGDIYARQVQIKGNKLQRAAFLVRWAGVLRHTGRYKEAAEHLVQVLDIRPEQQEALYELLELCREAPDAYDFASAFSSLLKDASKREDRLARALLLAGSGILAEHQNDIDAALDLFSRALEEGGERVQLARFKADLLVLLGREQEAVELIKRCSQASREAGLLDWIDGPLWLADYHAVWRGDYDQAADLCGAILKELPDCLEARLQLARMEMLVGRPAEAQVQQLHICDQMAREQADARQLAERFHAVGLAALRAGNQQAAESSWRRACELAPDWPFPFVALARSRLAKGEPELAEQQLLKAATNAGADSPVLLRAQAAFYAGRGQHGRALEFAQRAADLPTADLEDVVVLAHHLARHGEVSKAVATLREALASDATYLPVIRELHEVWSASGQRQLARRAQQVLNVALGSSNAEPGQLLREPISPASWTKLMADLTPHPLNQLWQTLGENLISRFEVAPPQTAPATPEYQLACRQLADVFDVHVRVMVAQQSGALFRLLGDVLAVSPEAAPLGAAEARALVAMGLAAKKSGHAAFFGLPRSLRLDASRLLACLLVAENEWPVEARELVARLPRREQRQVQRLASQTRLESKVIDSTAHAWTVAAEAWCMRTALLVTEDLASVARLLALQQDPGWMGEGSLFAALPEVPEIASYYLSESFQALHQSMQGTGE